ncbi:MAG: hypothetical protein ACTSQJ_08440 [Promethearchaeota archaeon]
MEQLEGLPAIFYATLWQTREMGFLKKILNDLKIKHLRILFFFKDYIPGALITLDGELGEYFIEPIYSIENVEYDGAIIGNMKPIIDSFEGNIILRGIRNLITSKVKLKGKMKLLKFGKLLMRCAI